MIKKTVGLFIFVFCTRAIAMESRACALGHTLDENVEQKAVRGLAQAVWAEDSENIQKLVGYYRNWRELRPVFKGEITVGTTKWHNLDLIELARLKFMVSHSPASQQILKDLCVLFAHTDEVKDFLPECERMGINSREFFAIDPRGAMSPVDSGVQSPKC